MVTTALKPNLNYSQTITGSFSFSDSKITLTCFDEILGQLAKAENRKRKRNGEAQKAFDQNLHHIIAELYSAFKADPDLFLAVPMKKSSRNIGMIDISSRSFRSIIDLLNKPPLNLIERHTGFYDAKTKQGRITRIRATPKLIDTIEQKGLTWAYIQNTSSELVVLREGSKKDKHDIEYEETPFTKRARTNLELTNLNRQTINSDDHNPVNFAKKSLYRVFSRGSFEKGGRFYGPWWQSIPSEFRSYIRIDSFPTVEVDYSGMSIAMLYAMEDQPMPEGDPYHLEGYSPALHRKTIKKIFNALLNVELDGRIDSRDMCFPDGKKQSDLIKDLSEAHPLIAHHFKTGIGLTIQYRDSKIAEHVLLKLNEQGIIALPVHDSFLVRKRYVNELMIAMQLAFEEEMRSPPSMTIEASLETKQEYERYKAGMSPENFEEDVIQASDDFFKQEVLSSLNADNHQYSGYLQRKQEWIEWLITQPEECLIHINDFDYRVEASKFSFYSTLRLKGMVVDELSFNE